MRTGLRPTRSRVTSAPTGEPAAAGHHAGNAHRPAAARQSTDVKRPANESGMIAPTSLKGHRGVASKGHLIKLQAPMRGQRRWRLDQHSRGSTEQRPRLGYAASAIAHAAERTGQKSSPKSRNYTFRSSATLARKAALSAGTLIAALSALIDPIPNGGAVPAGLATHCGGCR